VVVDVVVVVDCDGDLNVSVAVAVQVPFRSTTTSTTTITSTSAKGPTNPENLSSLGALVGQPVDVSLQVRGRSKALDYDASVAALAPPLGGIRQVRARIGARIDSRTLAGRADAEHLPFDSVGINLSPPLRCEILRHGNDPLKGKGISRGGPGVGRFAVAVQGSRVNIFAIDVGVVAKVAMRYSLSQSL
jgi:hypothetical protein